MLGGRYGFDPLFPSSACASVTRLRRDGSPDTSFGGVGRFKGRRKLCTGAGLVGRSVAITRDRKILLGGAAYHSQRRTGAFIARLTSKGELDHSLRGDRRTATAKRASSSSYRPATTTPQSTR